MRTLYASQLLLFNNNDLAVIWLVLGGWCVKYFDMANKVFRADFQWNF